MYLDKNAFIFLKNSNIEFKLLNKDSIATTRYKLKPEFQFSTTYNVNPPNYGQCILPIHEKVTLGTYGYPYIQYEKHLSVYQLIYYAFKGKPQHIYLDKDSQTKKVAAYY